MLSQALRELTANLPFDDPMCRNLYRQCGEVGLPPLTTTHAVPWPVTF